MWTKKDILISALIGVALASFAWAIPRGPTDVTRVAQNDGNTPVGIYVACSSTAWTAVVAADEDRRLAVVKNLSDATYDVCTATHSTVGIGCPASPGGYYLEPGDAVSWSGEAALYCRLQAGGDSETLIGMSWDDSRD